MGTKTATKRAEKEPIDRRQALVEKIIARMEEAVEYSKPWLTANNGQAFPYNPHTGTRYRGINIVSLLSEDFIDPRFYTFNNVRDIAKATGEDIHVKKGSVGIPIFKAVQVSVGGKREESNSGDDIDDADEGAGKRMIWVQAYAGVVFNASQIEGIPPLDHKLGEREHEKFDEIELMAEAMQKDGVLIEHRLADKACYRQSNDSISLPPPEQFKYSSGYYRTLMHEMAHSTGHPSRLNRKLDNSFGDANYAFEELVAELSSYFIGNEVGLPYDRHTHDNHAGYLKSWIAQLKGDKNLLFKAASKANQVVSYTMELTNALRIERNLIDQEVAAPSM